MISIPDCSRAAGQRAYISGKAQMPRVPVNVYSNTCQADSLYRVINHPSQHECSHWLYYICISKILFMDQQLVHSGYVRL